MQCQDTDRAGVREDRHPSSAVFLKDSIHITGSPVQHLPVTFTAEKYMIEVAVKKGLVLIRMLLCCLLERQTLHNPHASFPECFGLPNWQSGLPRKGCCGFNGTRQVA
jgi:hypothetical protein